MGTRADRFPLRPRPPVSMELPMLDIAAYTLWLIVAAVAGVLEMATPGFFGFVFVAVAALLAAAVDALGLGGGALQLAVFGAASLLGLVFLRPRFATRMAAQGHVPSRTERLVGHHGRVTEAIDPVRGTGRVLVAGEDWAARATHPLPEGVEVLVSGADGIVLLVRSAEKAAP